MNRLLIIAFFLLPSVLLAQSHDFLLLKKRGRTIATYYPGNDIAFTTDRGVYISATITRISNDSISLIQYNVQQVSTRLGVNVLDTLGSYRYDYNYKQIKAIGNPGRKFNLTGSAASLMGGGALLMMGNGVVYLADRSKFSPGLLIGSAALAGVGYLIARFGGKGIVIGKKYKLVYLNVQ